MRKAEFKKQAEKYTDSYGDLMLVVYKASQYRWQDGRDTEEEDEAYFFTQEEAEEYLKTIRMNIGFEPHIDRVDFEYADFNWEINFGADREIEDFLPSRCEFDTVYYGSVFEGNDIIGAVIVRWSYEKYVGYCRNLKDIGIAGEYPFHELTTEKDLITGNEGSTFKDNYSVLLTKDEVDEANNLFDAIEEELQRGHWKWNYFRNNPNTEHIQETIRKICGIPDYPFCEGDDYWTIEDGEVVWSCWDEQSEALFRENPDKEYFETEEEAKNSLL
jgi:hypothetical protein